ncbi:hypothetical protein LTR62_000369 [Meristemomyces frigidus]|uniref:Uncharacterized protein n=1 Tax=Meristemomyces frigidus TaxID=1508187 RepID=A0AAN7TLA5_9PEZI|nr:hypothetical protein LTR62_000369 [Meristemomyces frigidus]
MAVTLGKRKQRKASEADVNVDNSDAQARALFQRAFEAKFRRLDTPVIATKQPELLEDEDEDEDVLVDGGEGDTDWSGLSEEDELSVQVVDHGSNAYGPVETTRDEMRAFMSSKPPPSSSSTHNKVAKKSKIATKDAEEGDDEAGNLKQDLALQRLLKESHLLESSSFSGASASGPEGKSRLKALDLRLKDLGAKKAASEQVKMPAAHRKGIAAKATSREAARRKEATENGIVLEKVKRGFEPAAKRERTVGVPSVGKFKGGTLRLSSKDVKAIEGPRKKVGAKGQRR